jgi:hypothetical protein
VTPAERCTWCGAAVDLDDGYRVGEEPGERRACFCRLEHCVPWALQGAHWEAGAVPEPEGFGDELSACAHCGKGLDDVRVLLVRHRGEHRIPDAFCSPEHMAAWARAGGRYQ